MEVIERDPLEVAAFGQRLEQWRWRGRRAVHEDAHPAGDEADRFVRSNHVRLPLRHASRIRGGCAASVLVQTMIGSSQ